jgi:hypothetical protein
MVRIKTLTIPATSSSPNEEATILLIPKILTSKEAPHCPEVGILNLINSQKHTVI